MELTLKEKRTIHKVQLTFDSLGTQSITLSVDAPESHIVTKSEVVDILKHKTYSIRWWSDTDTDIELDFLQTMPRNSCLERFMSIKPRAKDLPFLAKVEKYFNGGQLEGEWKDKLIDQLCSD